MDFLGSGKLTQRTAAVCAVSAKLSDDIKLSASGNPSHSGALEHCWSFIAEELASSLDLLRRKGTMRRSVLAVAALAILCTTVGRADGARQLSQATKPSVADCTFTGGSLVSSAWKDGGDFLLVTPAAAMRCFNTIELDYEFVYQGLYALANLIRDTYVFVALAADPSGTNQTNPYGFKVFPDKVDVPGELKDMADSWPENKPVPLGTVHFAVNDVFNRLRDAHVTYNGGGTTFGGVITRLASQNGQRALLVDGRTSAVVNQVLIGAAADGTTSVALEYAYPTGRQEKVVIKTINGKPPMDTIIDLANSPALSLPFKALGTRINALIGSMGNLFIKNMGDLSQLESVVVEYANGTMTTLNWGITMAAGINASTLAIYRAQANTPGVPYQALQKALDKYDAVAEAPAPAAEAPPANAVRRVLQGTKLEYIGDYGMYYFNKTRATLKLTGFGFGPDDLATWWPSFVAAAKQQGATKLVLDLTDNGGGVIVTGVNLALALYPTATLGDFGISYDRIMGPDAVYVYSNGLKPQAVDSSYQALCNNATWLQARVDAINNNATEFARLGQVTTAIFEAITTLFNASSNAQGRPCTNPFTNDTVKCDVIWNQLAVQAKKILASVVDSGVMTTENLQAILLGTTLHETFWPYGGGTINKDSDPYLTPAERTRGGVARNYTGKYNFLAPTTSITDAFPDWTNVTTTPPFNKILVVGNGYCGSTCDTFSQSAWLYSKNNPTAPKFKYATFGGTGNISDSSCTSFPGGNVNNNDLLTQAWAYYAILHQQAEWSGDQTMMDKVDVYSDLLPDFPSFLDTRTPSYTQSEIYRAALGPNSLPTEFYLIPPDYQINAWYQLTDIPQEGTSTELFGLYREADKILAKM